jgi:hypothetical protein
MITTTILNTTFYPLKEQYNVPVPYYLYFLFSDSTDISQSLTDTGGTGMYRTRTIQSPPFKVKNG